MIASSFARRAVKAAVLPTGFAAGRRPGDVVVLLYHRVGLDGSEISLSAELFQRQLELLASGDHLLSIDQAVTPGGPGGVVVSIDDGYRDFYDVVLPLLVRYQVPAVLYLATALVAGESTASATDPDALRWGQLAEALATGLVTIGSHTHTHANLSRAPEHLAEAELARSKGLIEDHLGVACRHFAYPWAVGSPAADKVVRRLFDTAALDAWRTNRAGEVDPWRLGRTPVLRSDGLAFFKAKVKGRRDGEALVYRALGRGPWRRT
jgi:peptidoglycan/xylan/chitin deacetylase (PgdA/CDA1 family)